MRARDLAHYVLHKVSRGGDSKKTLEGLETYLEKMNRLDLYPLVLKYLKTLMDSAASKDVVNIVSPYEVKAVTVKEIVHRLADEKVAHAEEIDEEMIGGFEAVYQDKKIGINLKTNLDAFKKHLTK